VCEGRERDGLRGGSNASPERESLGRRQVIKNSVLKVSYRGGSCVGKTEKEMD
jgi:hypothetical protein